ncbi:MAG: DNA mismatch repair endonuclease MutL [Bacteroidia bacterium]|nr:DNA mismatch repair endonuclease MutL [Bacteroidia bacterium]
MSDLIQLLPDFVASQIAAGEVIQRPASALKELMENSFDSGATKITVILKDAGKTLIQVIDNGCGMSENDARLCWERHATSKIKSADELSHIRTMGFRGEALASIAAIAHVEMKTKRQEDNAGVLIAIEGSELKKQEPAGCANGTNISVRNLFFNVPARRNFLKSNTSELRHLIDEFERQALAHPEIAFKLQSNEDEMYYLTPGNLKQRIIQLYGASYNERLVPVKEDTTAVSIRGFIIKPEFCKKSRGEQFFFLNNRYIRDNYLHHAVTKAFSELLPKDAFASYFLFLQMNPADIDVNIHPTKTEIKFRDERLIYQIVKSAVKHALGKFSLMPSLDFEQEVSFQLSVNKLKEIPKIPFVKIDSNFNPFRSDPRETATREWIKLHDNLDKATQPVVVEQSIDPASGIKDLPTSAFSVVLHKYIIIETPTGLLIVDSQSAMERIYFDHLVQHAKSKQQSQQCLFPQLLEFSSGDFLLLASVISELNQFGFEIAEFGKNTYRINGIPTGFENTEIQSILEQILDELKQNAPGIKSDLNHHLAKKLASARANRSSAPISGSDAKSLITKLFNSEHPLYTPAGRKVMVNFTRENILNLFSQPHS